MIDDASVNSTSSTLPVAPPTPFAGGYRTSKHKKDTQLNDDGVEKEDHTPSCESSPSPIPICPPPPKDLLLPTSSSSIKGDEEEDDDDVILADDDDANHAAGEVSTFDGHANLSSIPSHFGSDVFTTLSATMHTQTLLKGSLDATHPQYIFVCLI